MTQRLSRFSFPNGSSLADVLTSIQSQGGRPYIVGGWVRDLLLGVESTDVDVEVFGIGPDCLADILERYGSLDLVGKAFAVFRVSGSHVEFSLPRVDSKVSEGHQGFEVTALPDLSFREAARRRDFTINAMGLDLSTGCIVDPWGGKAHLEQGLLEVVNPDTFGDDPLRVLRAAQFLSRFLLVPGPELVKCSRRMRIEGLARERIFVELEKMLVGKRPSLGAQFLRVSGWIRYFPEWASLIDVPQESEWHPEGDVWNHVLLALDHAAGIRTGSRRTDLLLMFGVLCHDFGKANTTVMAQGKLRSVGHSSAGVGLCEQFLCRFTGDKELISGTKKLVKDHLAPQFLFQQGAKPGALRRLARRLAPEVNIELLERCARADYRATGFDHMDAFPAGTWLLEQAEKHLVRTEPAPPVLQGRHLIEAGLDPGPLFGELLRRAYDIQMETGEKDVRVLLDRVTQEHVCRAERG